MRLNLPALKIYALGSIAFIAVFMTACEEYIEPPFEIVESKLIISSNFSPHDKVSVRITPSQSIGGQEVQGDIKNARVSIYEGDEQVESLLYVDGHDGLQGVYCSRDFVPQIGIPYTLRASADGFVPVTASSSIPTSIDISRSYLSDLTVTETESGFKLYNFELLVDYNDPNFAENFYDLRIKQEVFPFHILSNSGDTIELDRIFKTVKSFATDLTDENTRQGESSYLVADKPQGGISINLVSKINPRVEILGDLIIELRTVSRDYYEFQVGIQGEQRVVNNFFERSVSPNFSNIGGGYGVFAGYSRVTRKVPLAY